MTHPGSLQKQTLLVAFPVSILLFFFRNRQSTLVGVAMYIDIKPHFPDSLVNAGS